MTERKTVEGVVRQTAGAAESERDLAVRLHNYVRDRVQFGFNKYFDATPPNYMLAQGYGHCNPKSRLLVALLQEAGLESYQHFVVIPKDILKGAIPTTRYWMIPAELSHSYVEVRVNGTWCAVDSHIVDTPLLRNAQARLASEGRPLGYGVRIHSVNTWDGQGDAFSQFDEAMMIEDHGRIDNLEAYFRSNRYRNHALGLRFNVIFRLMGEFGVAPMNAHIEKIRQQERSS